VTRHLDTIIEIASDYDTIVLDQWGVLHDGTQPYGAAIEVLSGLKAAGTRLAVLSNSGKRAAPNAERITDMGFEPDLFEHVMTSGEALWADICDLHIPEIRFFAIERSEGDARHWARGLDIELTQSLQDASAVLLMGLPDGSKLPDWTGFLEDALNAQLPVYCSNPDRQSPRMDGLVISPGALGFAYRDMGGNTVFYGKPYEPIFRSLEKALGKQKLLMVGDSLEHDISGGHAAGWDTLFVRGGLYADDFYQAGIDETLTRLCTAKSCAAPTYSIEVLK
jgi:HAD superfamily hydrolase (TIGR01459 family)